MTAPQITPPGTPPDPLAPQPTFRATFYAYLQALVTAFGEANTAFTWVNTTAGTVATNASAAAASASAASTSAGTATTKAGEASTSATQASDSAAAAVTAASAVVTSSLLPGTVTSNDCDLSTGNYFEITLDGNKTITFSNFPTEGEWSVLVTATTTATLSFSDVTDEIGEEAYTPPEDTYSKLYHFWTTDSGTTVFLGQSL